jgi:hypothetical protein
VGDAAALVIGLTGVGLSWVLAGAQWWRARRSVAGISVLTWSVFLALNATWAVYGLGVGNPYLVANGVGAALFNGDCSSSGCLQRSPWQRHGLVTG